MKAKAEKYKRVNIAAIKIGEPLIHSVYSNTGDLLLKKGRIITTQRQRTILGKLGFMLYEDIEQAAKAKEPVKSKGVFVPSQQSDDVFDIKSRWLEELFHLFNIAKQRSVSNFCYRVMQLAMEIQWVTENQQDALLAAFQLDHENHYGLVHALHCAVICEAIAKAYGLTRIGRLAIIAGALTHDFGIVDVQDELHKQNTPLTDEQWQEVKAHPIKSRDMLIALGVDDPDWLNIALHHHERLDGSGYPQKLSGEDISLAVRIMSIADIYTAIIRPTSFRSENSGKSALTVLYKEKGTTLDAKLVDILIQQVGVFPLGSLVRLANKEVGVVSKCGGVKSKPLVSAIADGTGQIYKKHKLRDTANDEHKIVKELSLAKHRLIHAELEKVWSQMEQ